MLPKWVQEVKDRADKATEGPWRMGPGPGHNLCTGVLTAGEEPEWIADCLSGDMLRSKIKSPGNHVPNMNFIAESREDIPRLIEIASEMAAVIERMAHKYVCRRIVDYSEGSVMWEELFCPECQECCVVGLADKALRRWKEGSADA